MYKLGPQLALTLLCVALACVSCTRSRGGTFWTAPATYEVALIVKHRAVSGPDSAELARTLLDSVVGTLHTQEVRQDSLFGVVDLPWAQAGLAQPVDQVQSRFLGRVIGDSLHLLLNANVNEAQVWLDGTIDTIGEGVWRAWARNADGVFVIRRSAK